MELKYSMFNGVVVICGFFLGIAISFNLKFHRRLKGIPISHSNTENIVAYTILGLTLLSMMYVLFNPKHRTRTVFSGISFVLSMTIGLIVGANTSEIMSMETLNKWIIASFVLSGISFFGMIGLVLNKPEMFEQSETVGSDQELLDVLQIDNTKDDEQSTLDDEDSKVVDKDQTKIDDDWSDEHSKTDDEDQSKVDDKQSEMNEESSNLSLKTPNISRMEYKTLMEKRKNILKRDTFYACMKHFFGITHFQIDYDSISANDLQLIKELCQTKATKDKIESMPLSQFALLLNDVMNTANDDLIWYNLLLAKYIDSAEDMFDIRSIKIPSKDFKYMYKTYPHTKEKLNNFLDFMRKQIND